MATKNPKTTKPRAKKPSRKRTAKGPAPSERDLRGAGFECADLAAAAERLGVADLAGVLARSKRLSAAWDRGQLLRRVQDMASTTLVVPERADRLLGLAKGSFEHIYQTDRIVRELWDRERFAGMISIERALVARMKEGDLKAVTAVEHLFGHRTEPAGSKLDAGHLTPTELESATGIKRAQWDRWTKEGGCPRNADGSYALAAVIDWLRRWERDKVTGSEKGIKQNGESALERLRRAQTDELLGRLLDRPEIIRRFRERAAQAILVFSEARADQWSHEHEGKTSAQLKALYTAAFRRVREIYAEFPPEVPMPAEAKAKIEEGIQMLLATEGTESTENRERNRR